MPFTDFLKNSSLSGLRVSELTTHTPAGVFLSWTTPLPLLRCLCLDLGSTLSRKHWRGEASPSLTTGSLMQVCVHDSQTGCDTSCPRWASEPDADRSGLQQVAPQTWTQLEGRDSRWAEIYTTSGRFFKLSCTFLTHRTFVEELSDSGHQQIFFLFLQ